MIYAACGYQLADGVKGIESAGGSGTAMDWCLVGWWETLRERECWVVGQQWTGVWWVGGKH